MRTAQSKVSYLIEYSSILYGHGRLLDLSGFTPKRFCTISSLHLRDQIFKGSAKY